MQVLTDRTKDVRTVAYTPDGRLLSGAGKKVTIWDPSTPKVLETIRTKCLVYALAVSPDGHTAVFGGRPGDQLFFLNLVSREVGEVLHGPTLPLRYYEAYGDVAPRLATRQPSVWSLAFSADGQYLAGAQRLSEGGGIGGFCARWWRVSSGYAESEEFSGHGSYSVRFAPEGQTVAVTGWGVVLVLDRPGGTQLPRHQIQDSWAAAVAFVPFSKRLAIGASSYLHFVDTTGITPGEKVKTGLRQIRSIDVSRDGRWLFVAGSPEQIEVYDLGANTKKMTLDFGVGDVHALACSPDGCTFAVGGEKGLMVCDVP